MNTAFYILVVALAASAISCSGGASEEAEPNNNVIPIAQERAESADPVSDECRICDQDLEQYKGELSKGEAEGLMLALNDEYRAWATYDRINKDFSDPKPFVNIQKAEGRHIESLVQLFRKYGLDVPPNKWEGSAPVFRSIAEACQAGISAEIANRDLYTNLFESTQREDIIAVYKALQSASEENHLPAFERCAGRTRSGRGPNGLNR